MAGTNSPSDISRREVLKTGVLLVAGVTGTAAEGAPGIENVKQSTRKAVGELQKEFPKFKLSPDAQQCVDDKIIDPDCDGLVGDEVRVYRKEQQLNTKEQQLDIVSQAGQHIDMAIGLIQLGMYVDYGKVPNPQADYIKKIQSNPNTPQEVQYLFSTILQRHREKLPLPYNPYGKDLLTLIAKNIDEAIRLQKQITDPKYKADMGEFIQTTRNMFSGYSNTKTAQKAG